MAVAERPVLRQVDPDAAPLLPRDRGREGGDVARAGAAVHAVVAVVAADDVFVAGAAVDGVDAEPAADFVLVAGAAGEVVVAEVAEDAVGAGAAFDPVVAAAAVDQVVAGAAADDVVAEPAVDLVVARAAPDHVGFFGALDDVVAGGPDDRRAVPVAHRRGAVFGARGGDGEERGEGEAEQEGGGDPSRHGRHSGGARGVVLDWGRPRYRHWLAWAGWRPSTETDGRDPRQPGGRGVDGARLDHLGAVRGGAGDDALRAGRLGGRGLPPGDLRGADPARRRPPRRGQAAARRPARHRPLRHHPGGDERLLLRGDRAAAARHRGHLRVRRAAGGGDLRLAPAARPDLGGARGARHRPAVRGLAAAPRSTSSARCWR